MEPKRLTVVEMTAIGAVEGQLRQANAKLAQARQEHTAAQARHAEVMIGCGLTPGVVYNIVADGTVKGHEQAPLRRPNRTEPLESLLSRAADGNGDKAGS